MITENQSIENFQNTIIGKKLILFGACFLTIKFINNCLENSSQVAYICDNNNAKHGQKLLGINIVSPNTLKMEDKNNTVVVLCSQESNPQFAEQIYNLCGGGGGGGGCIYIIFCP
jgi:hypothetical protein